MASVCTARAQMDVRTFEPRHVLVVLCVLQDFAVDHDKQDLLGLMIKSQNVVEVVEVVEEAKQPIS